MTKGEKEQFCAFAAAVVAPPDAGMIEDLRRPGLRALLEKCILERDAGARLSSPIFASFDTEHFLPDLQREYARLFVEHEGEKISLVESTYKPWTTDKECKMMFAASKGLVMGDCAVHMQELYEHSSIEIPEEFRGTPDHLILELEFLALLYGHASDEQVERFIMDHLNWVPELSVELENARAHPFYRNAVGLIDLFLKEQMEQKVKEPWTEEASLG